MIRRPGTRHSPASALLPESVSLRNGEVPVTWRRSARARRLSLRVALSGESVTVTLPLTVTAEAALHFLTANTDWIARQLARRTPLHVFADGQIIPFHGMPYTIRHMPAARGGVRFSGVELHVSGEKDFLSRRVRDFLQNEARQHFSLRLKELSRQTDLTPRALAIRDTVSRWGSCTTTGRLMLSWRLIMAPAFVQDYVMLHELAHLRHHNHSPAFWSLVDQICPQREQAELWLKKCGASLLTAG